MQLFEACDKYDEANPNAKSNLQTIKMMTHNQRKDITNGIEARIFAPKNAELHNNKGHPSFIPPTNSLQKNATGKLQNK